MLFICCSYVAHLNLVLDHVDGYGWIFIIERFLEDGGLVTLFSFYGYEVVVPSTAKQIPPQRRQAKRLTCSSRCSSGIIVELNLCERSDHQLLKTHTLERDLQYVAVSRGTLGTTIRALESLCTFCLYVVHSFSFLL